MENLEKILSINLGNSKLSELTQRINIIPESVRHLIEIQDKWRTVMPTINIPKIDILQFKTLALQPLINSKLLETLRSISEAVERIQKNPELHFVFISDLEFLNLKSAEELKESLISDLTDADIKEKEYLLNENLLPLLEELGLESLWLGANQVLESESNPDKLRHCLISLRTILEYLIEEKLAPLDKLKNSKMFEKDFKKYHLGKQKIEFIKIKRDRKIEYFTSKIKFGILEEFTKNEIQYVCYCYSILCNVHQPKIGLTENQVRSLKVKTGITIWLLIYLNKILESDTKIAGIRQNNPPC